MKRSVPYKLVLSGLLLSLLGTGCGAENAISTNQAETPRPVSVMPLFQDEEGRTTTMTGSVGAWKTEDIGFEVSGRLEEVIEPGRNIAGRILLAENLPGKEPSDAESGSLADEPAQGREPPTQLARINDERYQIAFDSAKAAVQVAERLKEAVEVSIANTVPAQKAAAQADLKLAEADLKRMIDLAARDAASTSEKERAEAQRDTMKAKRDQVNADELNLKAQLLAREAEVEQARQQLDEARRNLHDTTLFSAFGGQVARVHAVAGTFVSAGTPVVTVQMMDPIKVELEVSAEESLRFRHGDSIRMYTQSEENRTKLEGFVHMSDPVADPSTRTFTVTLLCRNEELSDPVPEELKGDIIARTEDVWPLNIGTIIGYPSRTMVEQQSIRRDEKGEFVWKIDNRKQRQISVGRSRILKVSRIRIESDPQVVSFLGDWRFQPVNILPDQEFDPETDLVTGKLLVDEDQTRQWKGDPDKWAGDSVLFAQSRWMLRPGDLVDVRLPEDIDDLSEGGLRVPMRTIRHDQDGTAIFVVDETTTPHVARRIKVTVSGTRYSGNSDTLRRINVEDEEALGPDSRLIIDGVHFLIDGEPVSITNP